MAREATRTTRDGDTALHDERHTDDRPLGRGDDDPRYGDESRRAGPDRHEVREHQRSQYGGINWGAAFFGWLVAVGLGVLLTALLSAAGAAIGFTKVDGSDADTVGIVGGVLLLAVALISYFAGGYVAGRMSRFDGARQGFGAWLWGIIAALLLAILGVIAGSEYNLFGGLNLPRIPIDEGSLTLGGAIALAAILLGSLLAAVAGGKAGMAYHRRIDRAGDEIARSRRSRA
jgi:hypothetical protein